MPKKPVTGILSHSIYLIVMLLTLLISACDDSQNSNPSSVTTANGLTTVRLGTTQSPPSWLIHIAKFKGFFKQQGLDVLTTNYKSGKRALKSMFNNDVDLATTADGPVVFYSLIREDFRIIATIGISSNDNLIIARRDSEIQSPADLRGKAIATQTASSAHFYLYLFLSKNNLTQIDIIQSFMSIEKLPDAIVSGVADAIATREPFYSEAKARLGSNAITFETPGLYLKSFELVASDDYIENNQDIIQKFVAALLLAEQFVNNQKSQTVKFLSSKFNLTSEQITKTLRYLDLRITLDQSLILKLEEKASWIIQSKLTDSIDIPDFYNFIDSSALYKTKPEAMTLIRSEK